MRRDKGIEKYGGKNESPRPFSLFQFISFMRAVGTYSAHNHTQKHIVGIGVGSYCPQKHECCSQPCIEPWHLDAIVCVFSSISRCGSAHLRSRYFQHRILGILTGAPAKLPQSSACMALSHCFLQQKRARSSALFCLCGMLTRREHHYFFLLSLSFYLFLLLTFPTSSSRIP